MILHFMKFLVFEKSRSLWKLIFKATQLQKIHEYDIFQKTLFCTLVSSMNLTLFQLQQSSIYEDILLLSSKNWPVWRYQGIFKEVKIKKKIFRQSWTKYFETFSIFSTLFLYHKWNGTRLLSPESKRVSCLTSYQTT